VIDSAEPFGILVGGPQDSEAAEVRLAKASDPSAWAAWYDRYYPLLYRYAYARLGSSEDAEDVAAQTFLKAIAAIDRYRHQGKPVLAWLYRIARNLVVDRVRDLNKAQQAESAIPAASGDPQGMVDSIQLRQALQRLTDEQRDVLVLRYMLGMTSREAAEVLGKSEAAVYSLQVRGTAALRRLLGAK
jgi:RNA polymerase sigma-70 factor, ECF subfamily